MTTGRPTPPLSTGHAVLLAYAERILTNRLRHDRLDEPLLPPGLPAISATDPLSAFMRGLSDYPHHQLALLLALLPEIDPSLITRVLQRELGAGADLPAFGGLRGKQHRGILPTGETLAFLLDDHLLARTLLDGRSGLATSRLLRLLPAPPGEPLLAGQLVADPEWVERILTGRVTPPSLSPGFPAQQLDTDLAWSDLILPEKTLTEIDYLRNYLLHYQTLSADPGYGRHSRRGYRALFYGPPGTGKTLTAALLGKATDRPVFRVDLSMVVSKWIGETEKNLAGLFERAESKGWILFFDEADSLFSKRGEVKESRDKYANQETSFLLQRVENYDGLCILASNFRQNMDKAFTRRFESMVTFYLPDAAERLRLWRNMLPTHLPLEAGVVLQELADRYELTGACIANAVRHGVYEAVAAGYCKLTQGLLLAAIRREYEKEDRLFPDPSA